MKKRKILILFLFLLAVACFWFLRFKTNEIFRLSATWSGDQIHVYSPKDGPWYLTHLVSYKSSGYWHAVAQLPEPVTIIDSRGHYFSMEQIKTLEWIDISGGLQAPPVPGEGIGVMYLVPTESNRPPKQLLK